MIFLSNFDQNDENEKMTKNRSKMTSKKVDFDPPPKNDQKRGSKMGSKMGLFLHFFRHEWPDQGFQKKFDKKSVFFYYFWGFLDKSLLFFRVFGVQKRGFPILGVFFTFFTSEKDKSFCLTQFLGVSPPCFSRLLGGRRLIFQASVFKKKSILCADSRKGGV